MSQNILPQQKTPKLIVVVAFDRDEDGELQPVFGPAEQQSEESRPARGSTLAGLRGWIFAKECSRIFNRDPKEPARQRP